MTKNNCFVRMKIVAANLLIAAFISMSNSAFSQGAAVNTSGSAPDPSAMLDISSTNSGILIPRMTQAQRNAITSPATGLVLFQTDGVTGFYYNSGTTSSPSWQQIGGNDNLGNHNAAQNIDMNVYKIVNLADATAATDGLNAQSLQKGNLIFAADAGSNDDYAVSLAPALIAYNTGMMLNFMVNTANTGAATLNVNGLGAVAIKKNYNSDLSDNDILAGQIISVIFDGTYFQLLSPSAGGGSSPNPLAANVITTTTVTSVKVSSAASGGNVLSIGGSPVTNKGICYSTSPSPTIAGATVSSGSGTGSFISNLTGLTPNTTYYVRAFATNSNTTSYGEEVSFSTPPLQVGDNYGGGIVFYMNGPNNGLIAATADAPAPTYEWGCYSGGGGSGATGITIGTGLTNTANGCLYATTAAYYCLNLVQGGYSDWFLPSRDELLLMYQQRNIIGGFQVASYWTSTISGANTNFFAEFVDFSNGSTSYTYKNSYYRVRPIRAF